MNFPLYRGFMQCELVTFSLCMLCINFNTYQISTFLVSNHVSILHSLALAFMPSLFFTNCLSPSLFYFSCFKWNPIILSFQSLGEIIFERSSRIHAHQLNTKLKLAHAITFVIILVGFNLCDSFST